MNRFVADDEDSYEPSNDDNHEDSPSTRYSSSRSIKEVQRAKAGFSVLKDYSSYLSYL
jgi:hypothetical protein